uniref:Riboflavin transporter n=1 Tax=Callorhinchus milii TaxID=7868 RepID=V9KKQ5_CALMI
MAELTLANPLLTHLLVALFGMGSWVSVNALWVELPVVTKVLPEGWNLPAYLTVLIALANVGPLAVTLAYRLAPGLLNEGYMIHLVQGLSVVASGLLACFWHRTVSAGERQVSVAYLSLAFVVALACCTSNVTFLPFMYRLPPRYIRTFFVGQGLSALVPCMAALAQGVGKLECRNQSLGNASELRPEYLQENFEASTFYWFLLATLLVSWLAFTTLTQVVMPRAPGGSGPGGAGDIVESDPLSEDDSEASKQAPQPQPLPTFWTSRNMYLLALMGFSNALVNGVLPSIQTYSCLPYGFLTFHLAVVLGNLANPIACFIAMFILCRSDVVLGILTVLGTIFGAYILALAALSPCPPLLREVSGDTLVVLGWISFTGVFSYLKVTLGSLLHEAGHKALIWCGVAIQAGSLLGALVMFPMVSIYQQFQASEPCVDNCSL